MNKVAIILDSKQYSVCQKKRVYYTRDIAIKLADKWAKQKQESIVPYHCEYCGNYHIGHKR